MKQCEHLQTNLFNFITSSQSHLGMLHKQLMRLGCAYLAKVYPLWLWCCYFSLYANMYNNLFRCFCLTKWQCPLLLCFLTNLTSTLELKLNHASNSCGRIFIYFLFVGFENVYTWIEFALAWLIFYFDIPETPTAWQIHTSLSPLFCATLQLLIYSCPLKYKPSSVQWMLPTTTFANTTHTILWG